MLYFLSGDHSDLLGGGFVTLQGTGPDGESSFINVPTSSFGQSITDSLGTHHTLAIQVRPHFATVGA